MDITLQYNSIDGFEVTIAYEATTPDQLGKLLFTLPMVATEDADFETGQGEEEEEQPEPGKRAWN